MREPDRCHDQLKDVQKAQTRGGCTVGIAESMEGDRNAGRKHKATMEGGANGSKTVFSTRKKDPLHTLRPKFGSQFVPSHHLPPSLHSTYDRCIIQALGLTPVSAPDSNPLGRGCRLCSRCSSSWAQRPIRGRRWLNEHTDSHLLRARSRT